MSIPFFSVIIPTFNRADLLGRAIKSVINQSYHDYELIIVDDGSTDNTKVFIEQEFKGQVQYIYQENTGVCAARNHGARLATGKYLIFLDSDDWLSSDCLDQYYQRVDETTLLVLGTINFVSVQGNNTRTIIPKNKGNFYSHGLPGSFALSREVFLKTGGYDEKLVYSENSDLFYRIRLENLISIDQTKVVLQTGVFKDQEATKGRMIRYAPKRYENIKYFLSKHKAFFNQNPIALRSYKRTLAVCAVLIGKDQEARSLIYESFKMDPYSFTSIVQLFLFSIPPLARYYYNK